jgi:hypothetical protein
MENSMNTSVSSRFSSFGYLFLVPLIPLIALAQGCATQRQFDSPDQAVQSLIQGLRANDSDQLKQDLGGAADDILSSGDDVADADGRATFLKAYDEKHNLVGGADGGMTLVVGKSEWPLPIPVVKDPEKGKWYFDTAAGKDEILSRRVGRNELTTIQVCLAVVDAQREYALRDPAGAGFAMYAQKFVSDAGKKNGLYYETGEGETPSPLGALAATAQSEGYSTEGRANSPQPFHGYLFRMLKARGPNAPGGACDYVIGDKMIGGFGVVTYPAEYGNSGVMTFIVSEAGIVYQKDLGEETEKVAKEMKTFDPGTGWVKVETTVAP